MGKGSSSAIKLDPLLMELLNKEVRRLQERDQRKYRVDKLHSMGYETALIDGKWFYRLEGSDRDPSDPDYYPPGKWTSMDSLRDRPIPLDTDKWN